MSGLDRHGTERVRKVRIGKNEAIQGATEREPLSSPSFSILKKVAKERLVSKRVDLHSTVLYTAEL